MYYDTVMPMYMETFFLRPNNGDVDALAARLKKAGQQSVLVVEDLVSFSVFEEGGLDWRESIEDHFAATFDEEEN